MLAATGTLDNTYIVVTSDNGYHLGEHRMASGKRTPYEEVIRVALLVRGPGVVAGRTEERIILNSDLGPTFADFAGGDTTRGSSMAARWRHSYGMRRQYRGAMPA